MKRGWLLVLLISLGLNLGLGYRLWQQRPEGSGGTGSRADRWREGSRGRHGLAGRDSLHWKDMGDRRLNGLAKRLGLTPDQADALREVHRSQGRLVFENRKEVEALRRQLHGMLAAEDIDQPEVRRTMQELGRRQARLDSLVTETVLLEMQILEPEQRTRYQRMMPFEKGAHQMGRRGRGHGAGGQ